LSRSRLETSLSLPSVSLGAVPVTGTWGPGAWGVAALLLAYGLVWVLLYALTTLSPPVDNVEQLVWLRSMEWGYFKHPPLPTWVLGAAAHVLPATPGMTYALGAAFTLGSLALMWQLLRQLRGNAYAVLALLAALCITLYCGRLYYFNHNVVLMGWVACTAWLSWRVAVRPSLTGWALLGLVSGLGMLTKYQFVVALAVVGLWWLRLRGWQHAQHRWGPLVAAAVASLVFAPHLAWLATSGWMPMEYANSSSLGQDYAVPQRMRHSLQFGADWLLNRTLPAWLVLGAVIWWSRRGRLPHATAALQPATAAEVARQSLVRDFLLLWGLVPLAFMIGMGVLGGVKLHLHWGTAFMLWTVPAAMELLRLGPRLQGRAAARAVQAAWAAFVIVQALVLAQAWMASPQGKRGYKADHTDHFPSAEVAASIADKAREVLGGPIEIISGTQALAGAVAVQLPEQPRVLVLGNLSYSPWIAAEELRRARVIEVFVAPGALPAGAYRALGQLAWRPGVSQYSRDDLHDWLRAAREAPQKAVPANVPAQPEVPVSPEHLSGRRPKPTHG
jgi:4-amino-4-deoxy-L-arabinose transferase-like glycosyltransferase